MSGRGRVSVGESVRVWARACECGRGCVSVDEGVRVWARV